MAKRKRQSVKAVLRDAGRALTSAKPLPMVNPVPMSDEQAFIALIARAAGDPSFDTDKFKMLMDARTKDRAERASAAYSLAMSEVQEKLEPVRRDCQNTQTRSRYASYEALDRAIRPTYTSHGFALSFSTEGISITDVMRVTCRVLHKAGHTEHHQIDIPVVTKGPQGKDVMTATHAAMSAKTYGMRGLLTMIFNVALTDDDGTAAGNGGPVSDEQLWELGELITKTKSDIKAFCDYMGVDALVNLPAKKFGEAKAALKLKEKQQAEAAP
jgi:ERF superfamily.